MTTPVFTLERYAPYRRLVEIGGWVAIYLISAVANSITVLMDIERAGLAFADWKPVIWELSSNLMLLALVPAVLAFERRVPVVWAGGRRSLLLHLTASVVYSIVHVLCMVALREGAYRLAGEHYQFGNWLVEMAYEYLKDVRSYVMVLALLAGYRLLMLRWQGEASLLAAPEVGPPVEPIERPERFLVRMLGREFLIAATDIEWLQAAGNYVNLHVRGRDYPLRSTIAGIEEHLDPARFLRVHRSYIVNIDHLLQIEPLDTGDARLHMRDTSVVPCSRRYRNALRERCGS